MQVKIFSKVSQEDYERNYVFDNLVFDCQQGLLNIIKIKKFFPYGKREIVLYKEVLDDVSC